VLLAIDARNRGLTVGTWTGSAWHSIRRFGAMPGRSADEYSLLLSALRPPEPGDIVESAWISSVVPALTPLLVEAVAGTFGVEARIIGPGVRTGVKIRTDQPSELGADLVCAAAAAYELVRAPCIVVDAGLALTVSAISGAGEFLGAAIAPGITAAAEALRASAAQLPEVKLEMPDCAIGTSTVGAIQSGILFGYQGLVTALVGRMSSELETDAGGSPAGAAPVVVGTGDKLGQRLLAACGYGRFVPDLVLEGIALIAARNLRT